MQKSNTKISNYRIIRTKLRNSSRINSAPDLLPGGQKSVKITTTVDSDKKLAPVMYST